MTEPTIHPVILCGGSGTRLWPRSRKAKPKPFLPLVGERTLFEATLDRWLDREDFAEPVIVAGAVHLPHIAEQAGETATIIVEPEAKNTAPAIGLAAALLPVDSIMLVCPSDHHIADPGSFTAAARAAAKLAAQDWMVAFGIAADRPETGYGYIRIGDEIPGGHRVARFVEKPDRATAERFLSEGGHAWNGGIFAFRAGAFMDELERHRPAMAEAVRKAVAGGRYVGQEFHPAAEPFSRIAGESVDYAVMENTDRAAVVPADMGWSDIGNWEALRDARPADENGNRVSGPAELVECRNVLVETDGKRVSVIGLDDVIVVVDGDDVLVTSAAGAQLVGKLSAAANQ
ncbi:mannose-1-phosphate guanylyltransferase/mannose-6-phosphate isomerase [Tsuneonella deserti]|uniref:Mannose-1-phosphate guanylyltransferase/mannose-6-phosphate isomerase n=1 Tax=Tsuneonella deserti TaxID=2035528 RepID=A0ABQ1S080_9SPHN|nr:sugar phosphate nucleotidyltransferase [Tsuneonella deserti]GGD86527.1 mannose-1-phosphate guanylyltransferase/mannose-6-phosphate isomerase [Tsuneonella deserti]